MNVNEAYYESAIPSNLFDDDIDVVGDNDEVPIAGISEKQIETTEQQRYHHLETIQESINENKKTAIICDNGMDRRESIEIENDDDEEEEDDTIKALAEAVKIVQSQQQKQPNMDDEQREAELYGKKVKQTVRQQQETKRKAELQDLSLTARLSSSPVIAPLSEQEELLLAIDQCQMNVTVTDTATTTTSRDPHTHRSSKSKNDKGNVVSTDVSNPLPPKNYASSNPTNSFRKNLHNYQDHTSSISSSYYSSCSKIDHHDPPRTTSMCSPVAISTTTTSVTDTTFDSGSGSAFQPIPQNHANQTFYNDPFAFYPSSQFRQQYEHLFQQQCIGIAHAIQEYQQMLRWDVNGTVPPQYPVSPYFPPPSPPTPIGGSFSYQMQHQQWPPFQQQQQNLQLHHTQIISQSHQNVMNPPPPPPHPFPTYFPRQPQPQYERGLNLATPTPIKTTMTTNRPSSTFNPTYFPDGNTSFSAGRIGNPYETHSQKQYTLLKRPSSPKRYLKPKYVPLKESMYAPTTTSSTRSTIGQSKSGLVITRPTQQYRNRSTSTQTAVISTSESRNANEISPTITPHSPPCTPNSDDPSTENSTQ